MKQEEKRKVALEAAKSRAVAVEAAVELIVGACAAAIARGMPCMFPEGVVKGEWMSAWASIQITPRRSRG